MNQELHSDLFGTLQLIPGWPSQARAVRLPHARTSWLQKDFGSILFQEIQTDEYLIRYFIFHFMQQVILTSKELGEGLQSLLSLKGQVRHEMKGRKYQLIQEGQFTLLDAGQTETRTTVPAGKECQLLNVY